MSRQGDPAREGGEGGRPRPRRRRPPPPGALTDPQEFGRMLQAVVAGATGGGGFAMPVGPGGDDDGPGGGMPMELFFAMMQQAMMEGGGMEFDMDPDEMQSFPVPLKCPTCNFVLEYTPHQPHLHPPGLPTHQRFSHQARVSFSPTACPVCLDNEAGPPTVSLFCGHSLCVDCFRQMGGKVGEEAMLSVQQARQQQYQQYQEQYQETQRAQRAAANNGPPQRARGGGGGRAQFMEMMRRQMGVMPGMDDDDSDWMEDFDDEEDTDEDMPPLIDVVQPNQRVPVPPQRNNADAASNAPAVPRAPPPQPNVPRNVLSEAEESSSSSDEDETNDYSRRPQLLVNPPGVAAGHDNASSSSSDEDEPPALQARQVMDNGDPYSSSSDDDDDGPPQLRDRAAEGNDDSSSSSEDSALPFLENRVVMGNGDPASSDSDDEGSDGPPVSQDRANARRNVNANDDSGDSDNNQGDDDGSLPPPLQERNASAYDESSSSGSDSDSDAPGLQRRQRRGPRRHEQSNRNEVPPTFGHRNNASRENTSSEDESRQPPRRRPPNTVGRRQPRANPSQLQRQQAATGRRRRQQQGQQQQQEEAPVVEDIRTICVRQLQGKSDVDLMKEVREMKLKLPASQNVIERKDLEEIWIAAKVAAGGNSTVATESSATTSTNSPRQELVLPPMSLPSKGLWLWDPRAYRNQGSKVIVSFCEVGADRNIQRILVAEMNDTAQPIPSSSLDQGTLWMREKQGDGAWRPILLRPSLGTSEALWCFKTQHAILRWVMDQAGDSYILQQISPRHHQVLVVNGLRPSGRLLLDSIEHCGEMYPSGSGVWLTNVKKDGSWINAMFLSPDGKLTVLPERQSLTFLVCPSWNHQNILLLEGDPEQPHISFVSEYQPNGELCRRSGVENVDELYNQRSVPVNISRVKGMCAQSLNSVLFTIETNEVPVVFRAEWRFQQKMDLFINPDSRGSVTLFDCHDVGTWVLVGPTEGLNATLGWVLVGPTEGLNPMLGYARANEDYFLSVELHEDSLGICRLPSSVFTRRPARRFRRPERSVEDSSHTGNASTMRL